MGEESGGRAGTRIRNSGARWEDDGTRSDGDMDDGGSEGDDPISDSESEDDGEPDGPDAAELIAKVNALGDGLALLHSKVDALSRFLAAVVGAAANGGGTSKAL